MRILLDYRIKGKKNNFRNGIRVNIGILLMVFAYSIALLTFIGVIIFWTLFHSRRVYVAPYSDRIEIDIVLAIKRLSRVVQFKTISNDSVQHIDGDEFKAMHAFIEESFPLVHQHLQKEVINEFSLLYTWEGSEPDLKPIMLTCHLDVVPVEPGTEADWEYPPFQGQITDEYIYGRGTMDVQSGVMAILEAVEALLNEGAVPKRTILIGFGHDEEIDGEFGAREISSILQQRDVTLEFLVDEGLPVVDQLIKGVKSPVALVGVAEKGYLSIELTAGSDGGHSSVPQGKTAIAKLGDAINKLENNPMPARIDPLARSTFYSLAAAMPVPFRFIFANIWFFKGLLKRVLASIPHTDASIRTTTATTIFESGIKDNLIPTVARAVVNFRLHPSDTIDDVVNHVRRTIQNPEISIVCRSGFINPSKVSDTKCEAYEIVRKSIREIFPEVTVTPSLMVGATDARHYANIADKIYRFSPLRASQDDLDRVHGTNERLSIHNYSEMIQFYSRLLVHGSGMDEKLFRINTHSISQEESEINKVQQLV